MNLDDLKKPFPEDRIHWRVGSTNKRSKKESDPLKGIPLAYIDARDVMERLDAVVGPENWQCRYPFAGCCEIGIFIPSLADNPQNASGSGWVWKSNGAGVTDVEAEKGQYSDAFKRAAVLWGIGQYLYDLPNTWVELTGSNYKPFKEQPTLPQWATPNGWNRLPASEKKAVYEQSIACLAEGDEHGLKEIWADYGADEKTQLWYMFDSKQRTAMKELMK